MPDQIAASPIVLVDDSESDRFVACGCFRRASLDRPLITLSSGEELLEHLTRVEAGLEPVPVVLLDVNMPGLNGFEVLEEIRSRSGLGQDLHVVMLTSSDHPRDAERARACGANGLQVKPMEVEGYVAFFESLP
jgi:CheY-like chemotaxis protein